MKCFPQWKFQFVLSSFLRLQILFHNCSDREEIMALISALVRVSFATLMFLCLSSATWISSSKRHFVPKPIIITNDIADLVLSAMDMNIDPCQVGILQ